ncbi:MAG: hypothetical protein ACR2HC_01890 [Thermoleophilaceae bacterium]
MTNRARHFIAPALILLSVLAFPLGAQASPGAVVRDCAEDGSVDGNYSNKDLKAALKQLPADLDEYSDCRAAISSAIGPGAGGSKSSRRGGGGGGGSSTPGAPNPDTNGDGKVDANERKAAAATELALKRNAKRQETEAKLGKRSVDPTRAAAIAASETKNGLPLPVILAIVAIALLAAATALRVVGRRRPAFAQAVRRVSVPRPFRR